MEKNVNDVLDFNTRIEPIRVACVGDSITAGGGMTQQEAYPARMAAYLGNGYIVENYGYSGANVIADGDTPYTKLQEFTNAKNFNPDIVIIKLGTNDAKPNNWIKKSAFKQDLLAIIHAFAELPAKPKIYLGIPAYAIPGDFIDGKIVHCEIEPIVREIAGELNLEMIDFYSFLNFKKGLYVKANGVTDKIHPNAKGADLMGRYAAKILLKQPAITCESNCDVYGNYFFNFSSAYRSVKNVERIKITGRNLTGNLSVKVTGEGFSLSAATIPQSALESEAGYTLDIALTSDKPGDCSGILTLSGGGIEEHTVKLTGTLRNELLLTGSATQSGWVNTLAGAERMTLRDGKFTFTGYFKADQFKLITIPGEWLPAFNALHADEPIGPLTGTMPYKIDGYEDYKFKVTEAGLYTLCVDTARGTVTLDKAYGYPLYMSGYATMSAWDNTTRPEMVFRNGINTWTGPLKGGGDLKFFTSPGSWYSYFNATSANQPVRTGEKHDLVFTVNNGSTDHKFVIPQSGMYTVNVDVQNKKMVVDTATDYPVYITGSAAPGGWDNLKGQLLEARNGVREWVGYLKAGAFKFLAVPGRWDFCLNATTENQPVVPGKTYDMLPDGSGDYKFVVSESGYYRVQADLKLRKLKLTILSLEELWITGSAVSGKIIQLNADPAGKLRNWMYTGVLNTGELKLITTPAITSETCYIVPKESGKGIDGETAMVMTNNPAVAGWTVSQADPYYKLKIDMPADTLNAVQFRPKNTAYYLVGAATAAGWDLNKLIPLVKDASNPNVLSVEADLKAATETQTFKFLEQQNWYGYSLHPNNRANSHENVIGKTGYFKEVYGFGGDDLKWLVTPEQQGRYRITINLLEETITVRKSGSI